MAQEAEPSSGEGHEDGGWEQGPDAESGEPLLGQRLKESAARVGGVSNLPDYLPDELRAGIIRELIQAQIVKETYEAALHQAFEHGEEDGRKGGYDAASFDYLGRPEHAEPAEISEDTASTVLDEAEYLLETEFRGYKSLFDGLITAFRNGYARGFREGRARFDREIQELKTIFNAFPIDENKGMAEEVLHHVLEVGILLVEIVVYLQSLFSFGRRLAETYLEESVQVDDEVLSTHVREFRNEDPGRLAALEAYLRSVELPLQFFLQKGILRTASLRMVRMGYFSKLYEHLSAEEEEIR